MPICSAAPALPPSFLSPESPSQVMGSHLCWEPGLSHTQELRTGAKVQGLRKSSHPSVMALTEGRDGMAPETSELQLTGHHQTWWIEEGMQKVSALCCWSFFPSLVGPGAGKLAWLCERLEPASQCLPAPEETRNELHSSEDLEIPRCLSGLTSPPSLPGPNLGAGPSLGTGVSRGAMADPQQDCSPDATHAPRQHPLQCGFAHLPWDLTALKCFCTPLSSDLPTCYSCHGAPATTSLQRHVILKLPTRPL